MSRDRMQEMQYGGNGSNRGQSQVYPPSSRFNDQGPRGGGAGNDGRGHRGHDQQGNGRPSRYGGPSSMNQGNRQSDVGRSQVGAAPGSGGGMAQFLNEVDHIQKLMDKITRNMDRIRSLQGKVLSATNSDDANRMTSQLDQVNDETSAMMQDVRKSLKSMSASTQNMPPGAESHSRKGQQSSIAKKLMDVADEYQKMQTGFKQKYRQRMEREIKIARPDATPAEIERAMDNQGGSAFSQQLLSSRNAQSRRALEEVQSRHKELEKIERSLNELFQLFQDMQNLLDVQQEMINTIEMQVDNTVTYIEEGSKEMSKAIVYRKNTRKKMWWCVGIVVVLVIIIAIVVYFQFIAPAMAAKNTVDKAAGK